MISLNGKSIDLMKLRGVIGPGTGLGHSILFNNKNT
jgi:glucokinase